MSKLKLVLILLLFFLLGLVAGWFLPKFKNNQITNSFQAGWEAAKKRLADSGLASPMGNFEIKNVSGQVTAVQGDAVILKIRPLEPLADFNLDERVIKIDANTRIYFLTQKDQAQYQGEIADFNKKMQEQAKNPAKPGQASVAPTTPIMPPEFFIKQEAKISDIKVGATINVIAADKDIKNTKQFSASEIDIQPAPVMTPAAAAPLSAPVVGQPVK